MTFHPPTVEPLEWMMQVRDIAGPQVHARIIDGEIHVGSYPALERQHVLAMIDTLASWRVGVYDPPTDEYEALSIGPVVDEAYGEGAWGPRLWVGQSTSTAHDLIEATAVYLAQYV